MTKLQKVQLRVRSYELDSFGHVNNAVFLNYLEYARSEFLLQNGLSFIDFQRWKAFPYVRKISIDYKSSARYGDLLEISGGISQWTYTSFIMEKQIFNLTSQKLCAQAEIMFVFVNEKERPIAIPAEFREKYGLGTLQFPGTKK